MWENASPIFVLLSLHCKFKEPQFNIIYNCCCFFTYDLRTSALFHVQTEYPHLKVFLQDKESVFLEFSEWKFNQRN